MLRQQSVMVQFFRSVAASRLLARPVTLASGQRWVVAQPSRLPAASRPFSASASTARPAPDEYDEEEMRARRRWISQFETISLRKGAYGHTISGSRSQRD